MRFAATCLGVGIAFLIAVTSAQAADVTITQAGKKFSESKITISVGDTVKFVNDDKITHNIHSTTAGHAFDLGGQEPGTTVSHTFSSPGTLKVRCAIHPKMKLTIVVQ